MKNYDLNNTGHEVQERLDQVPVTQRELGEEVQNRTDADNNLQEQINTINTEIGEQGGSSDTINGRLDTLEQAVGTDGSVDERIAEAKSDILGGASEGYDTLGKVEVELEDTYRKDETYSKEQVDDLITTPDVQYVSVVATNLTTDVTDVLPETGSADTVYRVGNWDGSSYDPTMYSLYTWNGSAYVCLAVRSFVGEVYDISVNHPDGQGNPTPYVDLTAALGPSGANIPADIRRGGMSIKFLLSDDNKYMQYRYMPYDATTVATFTNTDNWSFCGNDVLVENPEYIEAKTDKDGKILNAIRKDGTNYFPKFESPCVDKKIIEEGEKKVDKQTGKSLIDAGFASSTSSSENPEYLDVVTDGNDKILAGIKKDGDFVFGKIPSQIQDYVENEIDDVKEDVGKSFIIENPYEGIVSKVRHCAISHEHMSGVHAQEKLEKAINDGVDIICTSNYTPGVPVYPLQGFSHEYVEWEFVKDGNGNIVYEKYDDGTIKTILTRDNREFKVPALKRVVKTLTGSFSDFTKESGDECVLSDLVQLPNAEHTQYTIAREWPGNGMHINLIGTTWADAVNGDPSNAQLIADIAAYCQENGYSLNMTGFHSLFGLWTIQDMLVHAQYNYLYQGKVFGTINHPGFSNMKSWYVDELVKAGPTIFKAMEIYNNGETPSQAEYSISFYDKTLMRGYKLWCLAVDDWGNPNHEYNPNNPERRGCNLMYLPSNYEEKSMSGKREAVLDAYINGSFAAAGYGTLDLASVVVGDNSISVSFNKMPDSTYIVIDGVRTAAGGLQTLNATVSKDNTFVRFEAYKDDDFIFTQPFYIKKR